MLSIAPPEEKLDPRVKRTRGLIQQAFGGLLAEKGFASITVQDITERAEVNRATFYAHFPDKYALLESNVRLSFRQELEKRTLSACHYTEDNLRALIITVCEFALQIGSHCTGSENQYESLVETQVKHQVQELLEVWLNKTGSRIEPHMAAVAASWAIYGLALHWSRQKNRPPAEEYAGQILPLVAGNLWLKAAPEAG
jgi:AcrR family transcriptional regulator